METNTLNTISGFNPFDLLGLPIVSILIRVLVIGALLVYAIYAAVLIKQVSIMSQTLDDPANKPVTIIAWTHLIAALVLTLLVAVVL